MSLCSISLICVWGRFRRHHFSWDDRNMVVSFWIQSQCFSSSLQLDLCTPLSSMNHYQTTQRRTTSFANSLRGLDFDRSAGFRSWRGTFVTKKHISGIKVIDEYSLSGFSCNENSWLDRRPWPPHLRTVKTFVDHVSSRTSQLLPVASQFPRKLQRSCYFEEKRAYHRRVSHTMLNLKTHHWGDLLR